jgi:adenosylhomocysteine nucleosidase
MQRCAVPWSGSGPTNMRKLAIVAALEREVSGLTKGWSRVQHAHEGRRFVFFERDEMVVVCGGIGVEAARRAAEAAIALYRPTLVQSVGFAGALDAALHIGDILEPAVVIDARDGSRVELEGGNGVLVTFMEVAGSEQKANLAQAYGAQLVDMEAAAVAAAARAHSIEFRAIKVISDELGFEMPQMHPFINAHGRFNTASFTLFVTLRPWLWNRVARMARDSSKAAAVLGEHLRSRERLSSLGSTKSPPAASHVVAGGLPTKGRR